MARAAGDLTAGHGLRLRLVVLDDGTLAVQSQGFGETLDPRWTFHAACSPAHPAVEPDEAVSP